MFGKIAEIFKQKELRNKILITIALLSVFRMGSFLPIPYINSEVFKEWFQRQASATMGQVISMVGMITGGTLSRATVFSLGIMPYISASIIFTLLVKVIPSLKTLSDEGGSGRRKINQYTRYLTVAICVVQSAVTCVFITNQIIERKGGTQLLYLANRGTFIILGVITITTGTMILMWLGEQISEYGIGNGISLLIMVGIVSRIPPALIDVQHNFRFSPEPGTAQFGVGRAFVLIGLFLGILFAVVFIYLGKRLIPVQYGRMIRGRREMGGKKQALWLRVNQAGVIPVIFASALLTAPMMICGAFNFPFFRYYSFEYNTFYVLLIIFFSYFYTSMSFNPDEIADNLKEYGSFIPGYRAGKKTAEFLKDTMVHLTFVGGVFLAIVAMLPILLSNVAGIRRLAYSSLFGGVGLLIVIGVSLDLMQKIQEYFYVRDYAGFLKKPIRGRKR